MDSDARRETQLAYPQENTLVLGWRGHTVEALQDLGQTVTYIMAPADVATARRHGFQGQIIAVPDPANVEHALAGLERHNVDLKSFANIGTNLENALVATSILGEMSGARSLAPRTAVLLRDKVAQKNAIRRAGLRVANCSTIDNLEQSPDTVVNYPLVVKPLAGAGTADTFVLRSTHEADQLRQTRPGRAGHGPWAVEEFIEGAELQIDGVVRDGKVNFLAVSRYLQNLIAIKDGGLVGTVLLDPDRHGSLHDQAQELASQSLAALGHTNGVFHLEAFQQEEGLVFSECAGRTSGGMVREKLQEKYGTDLVAEWGRALLGLTSAATSTPLSDLCYGSANLVAPAGEIVRTPDTQQVLMREGVVRASVEVGPGDIAGDPRLSSNTKAGRIVVAAETEEAVERCLVAATGWFTSQTLTN